MPFREVTPISSRVSGGHGDSRTDTTQFGSQSGFFADGEEQADHRLQGRPLGVISFAGAIHAA